MTTKVIMANDLLTGDVIFLSQDAHNWTKHLQQAWISESEQLTEQMLEIANESHLVIEALAMDVEDIQGQLVLKKYREQLRSLGPSVRPDLGKQALSHAA